MLSAVRALWPLRTARPKNQLFVVSLPKSGSVFIWQSVQAVANLGHVRPRIGLFPRFQLCPEQMAIFARGDCIASTHCDPAPETLDTLDELDVKILLHIRDPRAALLSWVHHVQRPDIRRDHAEEYGLDESYYASSLHDQIDWQIDHHFQATLWWLRQWAETLDSPWRDRIVLTRYEDLHADDEAFVRHILDQFDITARNPITLPPKDHTSHFRNGRMDEWREVFRPDQIARATEMMPDLLRRFGWPA